ncbi:hypothetical protein EJ110_NYTH09260 [Nymphaea thermarum]|nr:hypothetical protein EJ110_NYTH09260 [Nymphaea thermarum]
MVTNSLEPQPKSLYISKDDKFFNRLLSKETSNANTSCRVYYGVAAGEVPFQWETRPGTPKRPAPTDHIPPLTPPPSFLSPRPQRKQPKSPIDVFPKFTAWRKKSPIRRATSSLHGRCRLYSSTSSSSSSAGCEEELEHAAGSPTSPFRFGQLRKDYSDPQGCLPMLAVKNVARRGSRPSVPASNHQLDPY